MKPTAALVAASLTTGLVLAATTAAHAETWRHTDASGDNQVTRYDDDGVLGEPTVDPQEKRGDITNVTVTYSARSLRLAVSVRARSLPGGDIVVRVASSRGPHYRVVGSYSDDNTVGLERYGYDVECAGLSLSRTPSGYVMTVPRRCLDDSYRVRVGVQVSTDADNIDEDPGLARTYDDFLRVGKYTEDRPRLSPWIAAG